MIVKRYINRERKKIERARRWARFKAETGNKSVFNVGQTRKDFHAWQKTNYGDVV